MSKPVISDFKIWLDVVDPEGYEEVYALYRAVTEVDDFGLFKCFENAGNLFVKAAHIDEKLILTSENAKSAFLIHIDKKFDIEGDIEGWYGYRRGIDSDD